MGTVNKEETSPLDLTKRMIGREVFLNIDKAYSEAGDTILEVQDVWIPSQKETSKIRVCPACQDRRDCRRGRYRWKWTE